MVGRVSHDAVQTLREAKLPVNIAFSLMIRGNHTVLLGLETVIYSQNNENSYIVHFTKNRDR